MMKISEYEKLIDELVDKDNSTNLTANKVGNALFLMALDPNTEANLALKKYLAQQQKNNAKPK